jgi:hypothetical protein
MLERYLHFSIFETIFKANAYLIAGENKAFPVTYYSIVWFVYFK